MGESFLLYLTSQFPEDYVKRDPKGTIRQLTDALFTREAAFPAKNRTLQSYCVENVSYFCELYFIAPFQYTRIDQSMLVGEFYNYDDNGNWRMLGMRPKRTVGPCIEYDVMRLRRKGKKKVCAYACFWFSFSYSLCFFTQHAISSFL